MTNELARYLTVLIAKDIDACTTGMCVSSYECEQIEFALIKGNFAAVESFVKKRLNYEDPKMHQM